MTLLVIFAACTGRNSYYSTPMHSEQAADVRVDSCITMKHQENVFT